MNASSSQNYKSASSRGDSISPLKSPSGESTSGRLLSLDTLRGFDMMFIMGAAYWILALCALLPQNAFTGWLAGQMKHVEWNGLAQHDTIFPLFLFIAGVSFPFSLAKQKSQNKTQTQIALKIIRRGFTLVLLGLICNGLLKLEFETLRWGSVLGRIGLAWMFAALLFLYIRKTSILGFIAGAILIFYWLTMWLIPGGADPYSFENNLVGRIDRILMPGRLLYGNGTFDPEGLYSTLPAIVTAMLGMFTGQLIRLPETKLSGSQKTLLMLAAGIILALIAWGWNIFFPINKKLWTSSFVCAAGAYSILLLALFYYIIDVRGWKKWTFFFQVIGINSITIYMLQNIISCRDLTRYFFGGINSKLPESLSTLSFWTFYIITCWLILYFFYRKKIFLKV